MLKTCAVVLAALLAAPILARATTYEQLSFDDLVRQADVIFVGDVVDVHPYTLQVRGRTIVRTRVTFRVADPIYGTKSLVEVFDFLGGEANGIGMAVEGMPRFTIGDHRVVFAHRALSINPIVGFTQGLLRVTRDANGVERVLASQDRGLPESGNAGALTLSPQLMPGNPAMSLADFRGRIVRSLGEARKQ
jgi:hypothetical protein